MAWDQSGDAFIHVVPDRMAVSTVQDVGPEPVVGEPVQGIDECVPRLLDQREYRLGVEASIVVTLGHFVGVKLQRSVNSDSGTVSVLYLTRVPPPEEGEEGSLQSSISLVDLPLGSLGG